MRASLSIEEATVPSLTLVNVGIAIAAKMPITVTAITISKIVNAASRRGWRMLCAGMFKTV